MISHHVLINGLGCVLDIRRWLYDMMQYIQIAGSSKEFESLSAAQFADNFPGAPRQLPHTDNECYMFFKKIVQSGAEIPIVEGAIDSINAMWKYDLTPIIFLPYTDNFFGREFTNMCIARNIRALYRYYAYESSKFSTIPEDSIHTIIDHSQTLIAETRKLPQAIGKIVLARPWNNSSMRWPKILEKLSNEV
jgi:hypothetical protein